jgi:hypothetical protein
MTALEAKPPEPPPNCGLSGRYLWEEIKIADVDLVIQFTRRIGVDAPQLGVALTSLSGRTDSPEPARLAGAFRRRSPAFPRGRAGASRPSSLRP